MEDMKDYDQDALKGKLKIPSTQKNMYSLAANRRLTEPRGDQNLLLDEIRKHQNITTPNTGGQKQKSNERPIN